MSSIVAWRLHQISLLLSSQLFRKLTCDIHFKHLSSCVRGFSHSLTLRLKISLLFLFLFDLFHEPIDFPLFSLWTHCLTLSVCNCCGCISRVHTKVVHINGIFLCSSDRIINSFSLSVRWHVSEISAFCIFFGLLWC